MTCFCTPTNKYKITRGSKSTSPICKVALRLVCMKGVSLQPTLCDGAEYLGIFSDASMQDPTCQQDSGN